MSNAFDYTVTQPYGYDPNYPLNNGFHRGVDYGCPTGTPVVVNGVTIGLSGSTGAVTGPHLHVGRWVNGVATDPGRGGASFNNAVVFDTGYDSVNGNYVRVNADGALWCYLHLSQINVSKGQVLQGGNQVAIIQNGDNWRWRVSKTFQMIRGRTNNEQEFQNFVGKDFLTLVEALEDNPEADAVQHAQEVGQLAIRDQWDKQIYSLQDQLKATTEKLTQVSAQADLSTKLQKQVDDLTAKNQALITQQTSDVNAGDTFLRRLGQLIKKYFN